MTSSIAFDGTGDYINTGSATPEAGLEFGNSDFTMECYIYTAANTVMIIWGNLDDSTGNNSQWWNINATFGGGGLFQHGYNTVCSNSGVNLLKGTAPFTQSTWTHIALVRSGANRYFFSGGTQIGTTDTAISTNTISDCNVQYRVGSAFNPAGTYPFNGKICSLRLTKGVARYTANFTPPTLPLPTS